MHQGACSVKTVEITCARGPSFLDPICRNSDTIVAGLTVVAVVALGVATGGLAYGAVVSVGGTAGIAIPTGGGLLGLASGGTLAGSGAIILSPTAAGPIAGTSTIAGLGSLIHMAQNANRDGGGGDGGPVNRGDLKRVNPTDVKRWFGMDAHALKYDILGRGAQISRYDLYRIGAELVLLRKARTC